MSGIGDGASDSIIYEQNGFGYSPVGNFLFPELRCTSGKVAKKPSILRDPRKAEEKFIHVPMICLTLLDAGLDQAKLTTGDWLLQAWQDRNDQSEGRLPGQSISLEMVLPGGKRNERITLNILT